MAQPLKGMPDNIFHEIALQFFSGHSAHFCELKSVHYDRSTMIEVLSGCYSVTSGLLEKHPAYFRIQRVINSNAISFETNYGYSLNNQCAAAFALDFYGFVDNDFATKVIAEPLEKFDF